MGKIYEIKTSCHLIDEYPKELDEEKQCGACILLSEISFIDEIVNDSEGAFKFEMILKSGKIISVIKDDDNDIIGLQYEREQIIKQWMRLK